MSQDLCKACLSFDTESAGVVTRQEFLAALEKANITLGKGRSAGLAHV
jgi:hypothetical protein